MIHGYKNIDAKPIKTTNFQNYLGAFAIIASVFTGLFSYFLPQVSIMTKKMREVVLSDKTDHFNEDLNKDVPHFESIKKYILQNSAETSHSEISQGIIKSTLGKNKYRITKTKY